MPIDHMFCFFSSDLCLPVKNAPIASGSYLRYAGNSPRRLKKNECPHMKNKIADENNIMRVTLDRATSTNSMPMDISNWIRRMVLENYRQCTRENRWFWGFEILIDHCSLEIVANRLNKRDSLLSSSRLVCVNRKLWKNGSSTTFSHAKSFISLAWIRSSGKHPRRFGSFVESAFARSLW